MIVYAGRQALRRRDVLLGRGALEITTDRKPLLAAVLEILGRSGGEKGDLHR